MKNKSLAIVILTWNALDYTKRCLDSLNIRDMPNWVEVIIVDNGSVDGTVKYLESIDGIKLIKNPSNYGYAKAVNIGIRAAKKDADIVLLNNDVELIQQDWLRKLCVIAANQNDIGIIGVKIIKDNGTIQHCGAYMPIDTFWGQQIAGGEVDINQYSGEFECESVVFACAYIKQSVFVAIGMLSEDFFAYFEDTDFCMRAKQAGFGILLSGDILVRHSESTSTKVNRVSHSEIFYKSQKIFKSKWQSVLSKSRYSHSIDWHSIINFPSGYASSSRSLVEHLDTSGVYVAYKYAYGPKTIYPVAEPKNSDSYIVNLVNSRPFGKSRVQVTYAQGDVFERNSGRIKVGFTMLEVDGLPSEWVRQANLMDEIWVPSSFNKDSFVDSGVMTPIKVIPLGIDPAYFSPKIKQVKVKDHFTFLSIFEWGERKAPELLLKAFSDEFKSTEPVSLLCKVNNFDSTVNLKREVEDLNLRRDGGRIFIGENHILQRYELGVLYRAADCFVLPTRGEGWGMPILEAMACGLPVIATNWSSQRDFMDESNSLPLQVEKLIPAISKCPYYYGFNWAQPSYEHLRYLMRWVFEHQEDAKLLGERAANDALANWTWDKSVKKIIDNVSSF